MYTGKHGGDNSAFFTTKDTESTEKLKINCLIRCLSGLLLVRWRGRPRHKASGSAREIPSGLKALGMTPSYGRPAGGGDAARTAGESPALHRRRHKNANYVVAFRGYETEAERNAGGSRAVRIGPGGGRARP